MKSEGFRVDTSTAISDYPDLIGDTTVILAKDKVVPDVVDSVSDKAAFKVIYDDTGKMVMPGDTLSINQVANEPKVEITQFNPSAVYSLVMVDPDMPSPHKPEYKDVLIWMVNNIKKKDFESGDFTGGGCCCKRVSDTAAAAAKRLIPRVLPTTYAVEYSGPEPGKGTHRYVLLLFQQPSFQEIAPPTKRANFQTKHWAKEHGWGEPVAGVYFKVKHGE